MQKALGWILWIRNERSSWNGSPLLLPIPQAPVGCWMSLRDRVGFSVGDCKKKGGIGSHKRGAGWFLPQFPMLHPILFVEDLGFLQKGHRRLQGKWENFPFTVHPTLSVLSCKNYTKSSTNQGFLVQWPSIWVFIVICIAFYLILHGIQGRKYVLPYSPLSSQEACEMD